MRETRRSGRVPTSFSDPWGRREALLARFGGTRAGKRPPLSRQAATIPSTKAPPSRAARPNHSPESRVHRRRNRLRALANLFMNRLHPLSRRSTERQAGWVTRSAAIPEPQGSQSRPSYSLDFSGDPRSRPAFRCRFRRFLADDPEMSAVRCPGTCPRIGPRSQSIVAPPPAPVVQTSGRRPVRPW